MIPKVIETEEQYNKTLNEMERLLSKDPLKDSPDGERLALLATLLEVYENKHFHFNLPDPISAIRFRMEEQGLMQRDLVPYIGSKSKVSEVLAGKRPLTIQMIRALHTGLDIPAEVLLQEKPKPQCDPISDIDWGQFPIEEMIKRQWLNAKVRNIKDHATELMESFLAPLGGHLPKAALCRRTLTEVDTYSLLAWIARIRILAMKQANIAEYDPSSINKDFMKEVVRLSWSSNGPLLAQEFLAKHGIALIIERHLPGTKLDGGAMLGEKGPIIGLTLRHDRIDSFWFTLIHELAHVAKHLKADDVIYVDNLDSKFDDPIEKEADTLSSEVLVPRNKWKTSRANLLKTEYAINEFAKELGIHPAIVAGRIRHDNNNYTVLSNMIGQNQVRKLFKDISW